MSTTNAAPSFPPGAPGACPVLEVPDAARAIAGPLPLRDGTVLYVRALRFDDAERLCAFHASLSPETIYARFFHMLLELTSAEVAVLMRLDYVNRMALVATTGPDVEAALVGIARYARIGPQVAEIAAVVQDQWQGRGIGTALLRHLATYACVQGVTTFCGVIQARNTRAIGLLRACGFPCTLCSHCDGEVTAQVDLTALPQMHTQLEPKV